MVWWVAEVAAVVAALAVVALLLERSGKVAAAALHGVWLLALLKLMLPPVVAWPRPIAATPTPPVVVLASVPEPLAIPSAPGPIRDALVLPAPRPEPARFRWPSLDAMVPVAWASSSTVLMLIQLVRIARFRRRLGRAEAPSAWLEDRLAEAARAVGVRPPRLRVSDRVPSPLLWCWGRPVVLLPTAWAEGHESERLRLALAHECAHLKRRDHWVTWLELVAWAVWWWNPLLGLVRRKLRETADAACDARVVAAWPCQRRAYAETLLDACEVAKRRPAAAPALGLGSGGRALRRRLMMIMSPGKRPRTSARGRLILLALAILIVPAWSVGQPPPRDQSRPSEKRASADRPAAPENDRDVANKEIAEANEQLRLLVERLAEADQLFQFKLQALKETEQRLEEHKRAFPEPDDEAKEVRKQILANLQLEQMEFKDIDRERQLLKQKLIRHKVEREEAEVAWQQERRRIEEVAALLDEVEKKNEAGRAAAERAVAGTLKPSRTIRVGDTLQIEVLEALPGRPIKGDRVVRVDGTISLGFYGDLGVAGLNRVQIKEKLIAHLRKTLNDEVLGLYEQDEEGKVRTVAPADSGRVYVDESANERPAAAAPPNDLEIGGGGVGAIAPRPVPIVGADKASEIVAVALKQTIAAPFADQKPLREALRMVLDQVEGPANRPIDLHIDEQGLATVGATADQPVSLDLKGAPASLVLRLLLRQANLTYLIKEGVVIVTDPDSVAELADGDD